VHVKLEDAHFGVLKQAGLTYVGTWGVKDSLMPSHSHHQRRNSGGLTWISCH